MISVCFPAPTALILNVPSAIEVVLFDSLAKNTLADESGWRVRLSIIFPEIVVCANITDELNNIITGTKMPIYKHQGFLVVIQFIFQV